MKYIVLDLEATCWEGKKLHPNEIIEIGAVCIDEQGNTLSEFNAFVKPKLGTTLSEFCTQLTSITQNQVDNAEHFPQVLANFQKWIASFEDDCFLCSWGFYDKKQFEQDCRLHQLPSDWLKNHISIKHQYAEFNNLRKPVGMKYALKLENIPLEGTHHRGIDDAKNIAKIFVKNLENWRF